MGDGRRLVVERESSGCNALATVVVVVAPVFLAWLVFFRGETTDDSSGGIDAPTASTVEGP